MEHTIMDSLALTIVAMSLVFIVLTGLMLLMQLTAKLVAGKEDATVAKPTMQSSPSTLSVDKKLARVALLCALIQAAEAQDGKCYQVEEIIRIR